MTVRWTWRHQYCDMGTDVKRVKPNRTLVVLGTIYCNILSIKYSVAQPWVKVQVQIPGNCYDKIGIRCETFRPVFNQTKPLPQWTDWEVVLGRVVHGYPIRGFTRTGRFVRPRVRVWGTGKSIPTGSAIISNWSKSLTIMSKTPVTGGAFFSVLTRQMLWATADWRQFVRNRCWAQ
jgi:hypothetical protein